jgi:GH15 family glucan-1,4-alpha-glucosidase
MDSNGLRRLEERDGYLPIADHGLLGDGRGSALVGRDGAVSFMCVPRFDSPPLFCGLLDNRRGGRFLVAPDGPHSSGQRYVDDTAVLVTRLQTPTGVVEVTDAFLLRPEALLEEDERAGGHVLARRVHVLAGSVDLRVLLRPRGDVRTERQADSWRLVCTRQGVSLHLGSSRPLPGCDGTLSLHSGERLALTLSWGGPVPTSVEWVESALEDTVRAWRRWSAQVMRDVPQADLVRRSAITLKLLDYVENGAMIAAPTSSLPEHIGGSRNWDYRYTWIRDAAYAVFALRRIGLPMEAGGFLHWALTTARWSDRPRVLYDVDGRLPQPETVDEELEGYRASAPVRWGNAAAEQIQHDVYGEILDCAFQWTATGGRLDSGLWQRLAALAGQARHAWQTPDRGIWEVRTAGRPFTYSAAMCQPSTSAPVAVSTPRCSPSRCGGSCPRTTPAWWPPPGPWRAGSTPAAGCSTATFRSCHRTDWTSPRARSSCAVSGSWTIWPGRAASRKPRSFSSGSAPTPALSVCSPRR